MPLNTNQGQTSGLFPVNVRDKHELQRFSGEFKLEPDAMPYVTATWKTNNQVYAVCILIIVMVTVSMYTIIIYLDIVKLNGLKGPNKTDK